MQVVGLAVDQDMEIFEDLWMGLVISRGRDSKDIQIWSDRQRNERDLMMTFGK
jgi:hypothetical protein